MKLNTSRMYDARFIRFCLAVIVLMLMTTQSQAQVLYGALLGRVEDQSGAVLPGAKVTVTNQATGQQRETVADDNGAYAFRDLQAGVYDIRIAQAGFKAFAKSGLNVNLNNIVREDVRMEVGAASESVTVTAEAPILQTDRADVSAQLDKAQITNLPIGAGRNF